MAQGPVDAEVRAQDFGPLYLALGLGHLRDVQQPVLVAYGEYRLDQDVLTRYTTALMIEAAEFSNELPWKSWKDRGPDLAKVKDEFADLLHFIGTWVALLELYGITATELALAFSLKREENEKRRAGLREGYRMPPLAYTPHGADHPTVAEANDLVAAVAEELAKAPAGVPIPGPAAGGGPLDEEDEDEEDEYSEAHAAAAARAHGLEDEGDDPLG